MAIKHLAIIMDGNRRFAMQHKLQLVSGHNEGAKKIHEVMEWCREAGIRELTLYTFSIENFKRDKQEVDYLMDLFRKQIDKFKNDPSIEKFKIKVRIIGRLELFPKDLQESVIEIMEKTKDNNGYIINFALGYGGRAEIVDSVKEVARLVKDGKVDIQNIDEELIQSNLYLQSEPDLVIRTGGDVRVSNFLLWQAYYSEWYFCDKLWPEFTKQDLADAIESFGKRERRFGK